MSPTFILQLPKTIIFSQSIKDQVVAIKAEGNEHFKKTDYKQAISIYENGLNLCKGNSDLKEEQGTILKNKAACYLKMVRVTSVMNYRK
jgi:tetratricopeptide (TPR) repeat protein